MPFSVRSHVSGAEEENSSKYGFIMLVLRDNEHSRMAS